MVKVAEKNFLELNYIGKIKSTGQVFDLTDKETAESLGLLQEGFKYGPRVICVGQKEILPGIDRELLNKEVPSKITVELKPEEAFGQRNEKAIKVVSTNIFLEQNVTPVPGLQISVGGMIGTIKSVSGSRTTLDFNPILAGKEVVYELELKSIVNDTKVQLTNLFENAFHLAQTEYSINYEGNKATIKLTVSLPQQLKELFEKKAKELIPSLEVKFAN